MSEDLEQRYLAAVDFVKEATEKFYVADGELHFPEEDPFADQIRLMLGIHWLPSEEGSDFEISDEAANWLLNHCEEFYAAFSVAKELAASRIGRGREMPASLRTFTFLLLTDALSIPKRPKKALTWARNLHIISMALSCEYRFGLRRTRSQEKKPSASHYSAPDAVADALNTFKGANLSARSVQDLVAGSKEENAFFREMIFAGAEMAARVRDARPDLAEAWDAEQHGSCGYSSWDITDKRE